LTGAFFTGTAAFFPLMTSTSDSESLLSLTTFFGGAAFPVLTGAAIGFFGAGLASEEESLSDELSFFLAGAFLMG
jgi:hypothetical protein